MKNTEIEERHARIEVQSVTNRMFVVNMASDDSVYINDKPVPSKQRHQLADKDVISIKGRKFMVEIVGTVLFLI